jgi:hypothetical protein
LRLCNQQELQVLLHELYDPASPDYRHFLTAQQFTDRFGPTIDDYEEVVGFAQSYSLTVTHRAPNRLVLDVSGTVADIERAFQVRLQVYQHPTEPRTFYAPNVEPSVNRGVPVQGISGLNNFSPPHPMSQKRVVGAEGVPADGTGSGPGGVFLGSDIRAAYAPSVTLDGTGQAIGLLEFAPYNLSAVQAYFSTLGQPLNVPIVNVLLDGVDGICETGCNDDEPAVDIEEAISMAPNLSALIVYEGNRAADIFNQMATDNVAKQLSTSWGWLPADPMSEEPIFQEFAAQGQNLFVFSGDDGAYSPPGCTHNCVLTWYPSGDPYVTTVGGTSLTTYAPGGSRLSETAWSGSGGGFSTNGFAIPSYQAPVINSLNQGSMTLRNVPDVAAEAACCNYYCASDNMPVKGSCMTYVIYGTSLAAPRWAGFLALANQQANGTPIGFLNPTIYGIGQESEYGSDFYDITEGNNFNSLSPDLFSAVTGYDLVTGWGTPNGQSLLDALGPVPTGPNFKLAASPSTLNVTQGNDGTSRITVSAVNGLSGSVDFTVTALGQPAGVTASVDPASVSGSGTLTLTVSTTYSTRSANYLIVVTGTSGTLTQTAYVTLTVGVSGTVPLVSLSTPDLSFGSQPLSTTSPAQSEIVTNTGTANLSISTVTIGGTNGIDFAKSGDTCTGATVAPNGTCTVSVSFMPSAVGNLSASLNFADNASGSPQVVALSGIGGAAASASLSTASVSFGSQPVGTTSAASTVTVTNSGTASLTFTSIAATGDFAVAASGATCSTSAPVSASSNCVINVTFTPTATGSRSGRLTLTDNASGSPQVVALSGIGTAPNVSLSTTSLSFGNQAVGTTSAASTVTVTNSGTASLTFTSIAATGDFAVAASGATCSTSAPVSASSNCVINVTFTPTATGSRSGSLTLTDNASGGPQVVALSGTGTGPVVSLSSSALTFSAQMVGNSSSAQTITLTNTGNLSLTISSVTASGDFSQINNCGAAVSAGTNCAITVTFKPTAGGNRTGTIIVSDNGPNSPQTVALSGTGQDFTLAAASGSPTSATVAPGSPASYTLSVGGEGGFNQSVSFTCAGAPSEATCTVSPSPVTPGSSATNITVSVTTTAPSVSAPRSRPLPPVPPFSPGLKSLLMLALVLAAAAWTIGRRKQPGVSRWRSTMVPLASGLLLTLALAGCGGGGSGPSVTPNPGTPAGNYTLTVTGSTGSGSSALSHSMTLTLTVS